MADSPQGPVELVARLLELGVAGAGEIARLGSDFLLAILLAGLGKASADNSSEMPALASAESFGEENLAPAELISQGLLSGEGQYTRVEVAERSGASLDEARQLWRALGFPEVGDDQRVFTSADIAALSHATALVKLGVVDSDALVELARPLGNLMSRLASAQTGFISEIMGSRITAGLSVDDPQMPRELAVQALKTSRELLPVLELTTVYAWRRHLAAEAGRVLIPAVHGTDAGDHLAVVGFVDITGYTRISRNVDLTELASLLDRFEVAVLDVVIKHEGRVIKNLGDEIMFVIEDPVQAAEAALQMLEVFKADESLPAIHAGLAFGPVLYRAGDVYGPVVNIAARLCSLARKDTVRVDQELAARLREAEQFRLSSRTPRHVRGYLQLPSYQLQAARKRHQKGERSG